jgi:glycosyltransferase involved in cell wall biosynthesis
VGDGDKKKDIECLVKEKGLEENVIFIGATDDVQKFMNAFDVLALPSRSEGFPVVLIEAQCTGLHCVASTRVPLEADITGLVEYVDCYSDVDGFVTKLNLLDVNDVDRECVAKESSKTIDLKGYNIWENGKRISQLYESFLK